MPTPARALYAVPDPDQPSHDEQQPCDLDAERAVLGAALLAGAVARGAAALADMRALITGADFYLPAHETIWQAVCGLTDAGQPADMVSVAHTLGRDLERTGGAAYLHTCMSAVPTVANGPYYAEIVRDLAYSRLMVTIGTRLAAMGRTRLEPDLKAAARAQLQELIDADSRGWVDPVPLRRVHSLPPFPVVALPSWVRAKVEAVAHETQTPPDLAGTVALACLAAAAGGAVRVAVRPEHGWVEPVNLYTVCAMPPASRKSPVFASMTGPIGAAERILAEQLAPVITAARIDKRVADEYAERLAAELAKATAQERDSARFEAHTAAEAAAAITVPAEPVLFADDITPEAAASMLAEQRGRFAILSAESEVFAIIAGRYSASPNLNVFLKGHAGDELRIDRRGRPRETVPRPALTLGICTQPAALAELAAIPGAAGRGLLGRFLFSVPDSNIGKRDTKPTAADPAAHADYARNLTALTLSLRELDETQSTSDGAEPVVTLRLTPQASQIVDGAAADFETAMDDGGPLAQLRDWGGKAVGAMMRIAGLLHLAEHLHDGYARPVEPGTLAAAHNLIEYYTAHTLAAFDAMTTDLVTDRARHLLDWLTNTSTVRFSARDAFTNQSRSRFPKMADLDPAIALLEQHGYVRRLHAPPSGARGGRPPAPVYEVHPGIIDS
jgi:replicative DNA helicase